MAFQLKDFDIKSFPIPLDKLKNISLDPFKGKLTPDEKEALKHDIDILRDAIIFFTACGAARGVSGHTGGPYDVTVETTILNALFRGPKGSEFIQTFFDEAGHRVATQYLQAVLEGHMPADHLINYRAANSKLPGHPELGLTPGVKFASGRLGHMWPLVNGVSFAHREKITIMLGSDGSQQEGDDAEAARIAVANNLNVKLFIDDNDVTIAGHPSDYFKGYSVQKTLEGHGLKVFEAQGEDLDSIYEAILTVINTPGPAAVIAKRKMAPGLEGIEGSTHGHDVIPADKAIKHLNKKGYTEAAKIIEGIKPSEIPYLFVGSTRAKGANRVTFGEAVNLVLDKYSKEENKKKVLVIDSDLEGSTGLKAIHQKHPEVFVPSGICERGNFSAAAGFGAFLEKDEYRTGVFSTFSAFLEMITSEATMARLNFSNVLSHFSHAGVDEIADNTCHFGINIFFADNGLLDAYETRLYFPADPQQMIAVVEKVLFDIGLRFVFSTRAKVPWILKENSEEKFYDESYKFVPGVDEFIRKGTKGYVVAFGDMVHRAVDAVDRVRAEGLDVGLINKVTLNVVDEAAIKEYGSTGFVLVVETQNQQTGLGSKMGTWLLSRSLTPKYKSMGVIKEGCGGLAEQVYHQNLDPQSIIASIKSLI